MSDHVMSLHKKEPVPDVIEALEQMLAEAKQGEITALLLLGENPGGEVTYSFVGTWSSLPAGAGWCQYAAHRIFKTLDKNLE